MLDGLQLGTVGMIKTLLTGFLHKEAYSHSSYVSHLAYIPKFPLHARHFPGHHGHSKDQDQCHFCPRRLLSLSSVTPT